jgi:hypothetical protein
MKSTRRAKYYGEADRHQGIDGTGLDAIKNELQKKHCEILSCGGATARPALTCS